MESAIYTLCSGMAEAVAVYFTSQFLYYIYHRFIHLPIAGPLYRMHHINHHKVKFPIRKLRNLAYGGSDKDDTASSDGWFETGGELVFGVPTLLACAAAFKFLPLSSALIFTSVVAYVITSGDVLHSSFHLYDDAISHPESLALHKFLVACSWFRQYQYYHDIHHAKTNTNFGFGDFTMDRLFGTFCEETPSFLTHPPALSTLDKEKATQQSRNFPNQSESL